MRIALKLAYIGTKYNGFQIQPNVPTVEKELFRALTELDIIQDPKSSGYIGSGRTDTGVHALGQVVAFNTNNIPMAVPRVINDKLPPSIWVWSSSEVPVDFDPRRDAISREYRYFICGECFNIALMRSASRLLKGTHDFSNFAVINSDKSTLRTIERIDIRLAGRLITLDIKANSFLWHMVRKIVNALRMIGDERRDVEWLERMLHPKEFEEGLEPAPGYGLLLKNVGYDIKIPWEDDEYSKRVSADNFFQQFMWHGVMAEVFSELKENMKPAEAIE
ncbi:MAG: tRNA pseudouridine(38-40) synthase TruA [Methanosarcinales archaeon]|nr:tRNA pseudouridine(38-40) synthase TruA [Methanosarcinales archaeon]